jgi:hypothetical protein
MAFPACRAADKHQVVAWKSVGKDSGVVNRAPIRRLLHGEIGNGVQHLFARRP